MLSVSEDENGIERYMVTNDQGLCLIYTTSRAIAHFVNQHSRGAPPGAYLVVGGDLKSRRRENRPIFHYTRHNS